MIIMYIFRVLCAVCVFYVGAFQLKWQLTCAYSIWLFDGLDIHSSNVQPFTQKRFVWLVVPFGGYSIASNFVHLHVCVSSSEVNALTFLLLFFFRMCDIVAYSGCLLMNQSEKNTHIHKVEKKKNEKLKCSKRVFASAYKCVCLHVCVKCTAHPSIESNTKMV